MKVGGVFSSNSINAYSEVKKKTVKKVEAEKGDSVEISSAARSLSSFSIDGNGECSEEKVDAIRNQIANNTYKPNSKLIAQKMIETIKGREA